MLSKIIICGFLIAFSLVSLSSTAQSALWNNADIGVQFHYGSFITSVPKAEYLKDSYSSLSEINFSKPIIRYYGKNEKQAPDWGISTVFGNSGSKAYIGNIAGLFPFLNFKLITLKKFTSSFRAGMGAGYVQKTYNTFTNHKNVLIGSHGNLLINFMWKNQVRLSDKLNVNASLSFSHLSNANTQLPNLGLNIPALSVGLSYKMHNSVVPFIRVKDTSIKNILFHIQPSIGIKQAPWIGSNNYGTGIISLEVTKRNRKRDNYGIGMSFFYDPSNRHFYLDTIVTKGITNRSAYNFGPHINYEKRIGRFSIPVQFGTYILYSEVGRFFQNVGFRYALTDHLSIEGLLLAHWGKADFLHAGIDCIL